MKIRTLQKLTKKQRFVFSSLLFLGAALFISQANAATTTGNFVSSATLSDSCRIKSAYRVDFASFVPSTTGQQELTGTITIICTSGTNYEMILGSGANGTQTNRKMAALNLNGLNTDKLNYSIRFKDAVDNSINGQIAGDGADGTKTFRAIADGYDNHIYLNITLPLNQYVKPDNYYDNITVSLQY